MLGIFGNILIYIYAKGYTLHKRFSSVRAFAPLHYVVQCCFTNNIKQRLAARGMLPCHKSNSALLWLSCSSALRLLLPRSRAPSHRQRWCCDIVRHIAIVICLLLQCFVALLQHFMIIDKQWCRNVLHAIQQRSCAVTTNAIFNFYDGERTAERKKEVVQGVNRAKSQFGRCQCTHSALTWKVGQLRNKEIELSCGNWQRQQQQRKLRLTKIVVTFVLFLFWIGSLQIVVRWWCRVYAYTYVYLYSNSKLSKQSSWVTDT